MYGLSADGLPEHVAGLRHRYYRDCMAFIHGLVKVSGWVIF